MDDAERLLELFRTEAGEILSDLESAISALPSLPEGERQETLRRAMRAAHNVKGAAAVVAAEEVERLTHAVEDLLERMLAAGEVPSDSERKLILDAVEVARQVASGDSSPEAVEQLAGDLAALSQQRTGATSPGANKATAAGPPGSAEAGRGPSPSAPESSTIRVDTGRLDRLMACAGELLATEATFNARSVRLAEFCDELAAAARHPQLQGSHVWNRLVDGLRQLVREDRDSLRGFSRLTTEISQATKQVRMLPLRSIVPLWRQVVQTTAEELGKEVRLQLQLEDVELDRYLLDRLRDPLMHFLRNAVDHGLESAADRVAAGKPLQGTILVRASRVGARVRLEISDDGRGLDAVRVGEAAARHGLVTPDELRRMRQSDILELIFAPGFSTAATVTKISGRGVGLDIVRRRVEQLGGRVEIGRAATLGGSTFLLTVPASLLSSKGLLVRAGPGIYVLTADAVRTTLRLDAGRLAAGESRTLVRDGRDPLPVRSLDSLMGHPGTPSEGPVNVVVVADGEEELGLVVDEVIGDRELVSKPLPWNLQGVRCASGAVALPGGELAVAVDIPGLIAHGVGRVSEHRSGPQVPGQRSLRLLIVDDSSTARNALQRALANTDHEVVTAEDGEQAWSLLLTNEFDIVLTDVQMPNLDGFSLTRRIRKTARLESLPVVLVTNLTSAADIAEGAAAGADEYMVKGSYSDGELLRLLDRLI